MNEEFGIPFEIGKKNYDLYFYNDVKPQQIKEKSVTEMKSLLYDSKDADNRLAYKFYAEIYTDKLQETFKNYGYTNGITVVMPDKVNGECLKNSGHYHLISAGHSVPFMESYEVLEGEAAFLLQKSRNFTHVDEAMEVEDCVVVFMKKGDKLVVPPFYAHCAVNIGKGPMLFGNLAAPCELDYAPIQENNGFFTYVFNVAGRIVFLQNDHYENLPKLRFIHAKESVKFGLEKHKSLNESFYENPDKFSYLDNPEEYAEEIETLLL